MDEYEPQTLLQVPEGVGQALLSESDFRAVVRLLAEVAAMPSLGAEPGSAALDAEIQTKKKHLLEGLGAMVGADLCLWVVTRDIGPDGIPMCLSLIRSGASDEQLAMILRATQDPEHGPPENPQCQADIARFEHFTRRRRDWLADDDWYGTVHFERYRRAVGVDDFIFSLYRVGPDTVSGVGYHRALGREPFSERDRRLVHLVMSEVTALHRAGVPVEGGRGVPELSPRLRMVLALLLQGQDRAAIAKGLQLSEHTVNDYIKALYKHFRVRHRGQLLAKFMAGNGPVHGV